MIRPLKSVYSYYFPEVRQIVTDCTKEFPHDVFLRSIDPGLDDFHIPVIEAYVTHMSSQLPGLGTFENRYITSGSETIFHILAEIVAFKKSTPLYILEGEYEGYAGYGGNLGLTFTSVKMDIDFSSLEKGIFFISNPSARNGDILEDTVIKNIGNAGHEIILDLTYVGLTLPHRFDISHPAISRVVISLSKPYGLYYYRVGFCFSKVKMPTLQVNKWFKNILSLIIAKKVLENLKASELVSKYQNYQKQAVDALSADLGLPIEASDVLLLAHIHESKVPDEKKAHIAEYKRGEWYRFCLTPFFLDYEKHK